MASVNFSEAIRFLTECVREFESNKKEIGNSCEVQRLADLCQEFNEMFDEYIEGYDDLEEDESESDGDDEYDLPSETQEKVWFLAYYRVQMRGQFNMITECVQAAEAAGLSMETYCYIQSNYSTFSRMYEEDCKKIYDELMAEIYENE